MSEFIIDARLMNEPAFYVGVNTPPEKNKTNNILFDNIRLLVVGESDILNQMRLRLEEMFALLTKQGVYMEFVPQPGFTEIIDGTRLLGLANSEDFSVRRIGPVYRKTIMQGGNDSGIGGGSSTSSLSALRMVR